MTDWRKLLTDEHLWDYRCKAVPVPLVREIVEEVETLRQDLAAARAEIERLRAGGCTRDQRSTQWCAEAEALRHDIARHVAAAAELAEEIGRLRADLATEQFVLRDICAEWNEDCDPDCDSIAHSPTCKATNIANAKRALQADLAATQATRDSYCEKFNAARQRAERAESDLAAARALPTALSDGYLSGTVSGSETAHSIRLHYRSRRQAEKAFHALTDAIDAALAGERREGE